MLQDGQAKKEWLRNLPNISQLVSHSIRAQTQAGWLHGSRWASFAERQASTAQPFATICVSNRGLANARRLANYGLGLVRRHTAVSLAVGGTQLSVQHLGGTGRLLRARDEANSYSQLQASQDYNLPISKEREKESNFPVSLSCWSLQKEAVKFHQEHCRKGGKHAAQVWSVADLHKGGPSWQRCDWMAALSTLGGRSTLLLLRSTVFPELKGSPSLTRALLCTHIYKPIISLSQAPQERITEGGWRSPFLPTSLRRQGVNECCCGLLRNGLVWPVTTGTFFGWFQGSFPRSERGLPV